jgi:hypothetical protein
MCDPCIKHTTLDQDGEQVMLLGESTVDTSISPVHSRPRIPVFKSALFELSTADSKEGVTDKVGG